MARDLGVWTSIDAVFGVPSSEAILQWARMGILDPTLTLIDLAFHIAVVDAAHNPVLTDLFAGILETVRATYEVTEGVHPPSLTSSHHQGVAEAIAERDVTKARAAACGYLEKTQEAIDRMR